MKYLPIIDVLCMFVCVFWRRYYRCEFGLPIWRDRPMTPQFQPQTRLHQPQADCMSIHFDTKVKDHTWYLSHSHFQIHVRSISIDVYYSELKCVIIYAKNVLDFYRPALSSKNWLSDDFCPALILRVFNCPALIFRFFLLSCADFKGFLLSCADFKGFLLSCADFKGFLLLSCADYKRVFLLSGADLKGY